MTRALALVDEKNASLTPGNAGAQNRLLETKLYIPRARADLVERPRLVDAVRLGASHKLTIVVAPAGFGKTTLLAGWLADRDSAQACGWVSLDSSENEPTVFWAYVIRALQRIHPGLGTQAILQL